MIQYDSYENEGKIVAQQWKLNYLANNLNFVYILQIEIWHGSIPPCRKNFTYWLSSIHDECLWTPKCISAVSTMICETLFWGGGVSCNAVNPWNEECLKNTESMLVHMWKKCFVAQTCSIQQYYCSFHGNK